MCKGGKQVSALFVHLSLQLCACPACGVSAQVKGQQELCWLSVILLHCPVKRAGCLWGTKGRKEPPEAFLYIFNRIYSWGAGWVKLRPRMGTFVLVRPPNFWFINLNPASLVLFQLRNELLKYPNCFLASKNKSISWFLSFLLTNRCHFQPSLHPPAGFSPPFCHL